MVGVKLGTSGNLATAFHIAAGALSAVLHGRALDDALAALASTALPADRAAAQDVAYCACRRLNMLGDLAKRLMRKPNPAIDALVQVALSELIDHPERAHTVVDQAVIAVAPIRGGAYKGVLNAVLRRFMRERETLLSCARESEANRLGYPPWWIARIRDAWPPNGDEVLMQGNARAPMTLRVNRRRVNAQTYLARLREADIQVEAAGADAIRLVRAQGARSLPGFDDGWVSVQDLGAQLAAPLLDTQPGMRVLDACAAPGGKSAHILELADCELLALDRDDTRLDVVGTNLARLGLSATTRAADAGALASWWNGEPFDRVLLDAPCTASGVVRRHPDGKWLKRESDIEALAGEQARLLAAMWQVLRPGGKLLYATCSVFPEENHRQTARFLTLHPDALPLPLDPWLASSDHPELSFRNGQLLPEAHHDGFYYFLVAKRSR